jgi:hypothetical protein
VRNYLDISSFHNVDGLDATVFGTAGTEPGSTKTIFLHILSLKSLGRALRRLGMKLGSFADMYYPFFILSRNFL